MFAVATDSSNSVTAAPRIATPRQTSKGLPLPFSPSSGLSVFVCLLIAFAVGFFLLLVVVSILLSNSTWRKRRTQHNYLIDRTVRKQLIQNAAADSGNGSPRRYIRFGPPPRTYRPNKYARLKKRALSVRVHTEPLPLSTPSCLVRRSILDAADPVRGRDRHLEAQLYEMLPIRTPPRISSQKQRRLMPATRSCGPICTLAATDARLPSAVSVANTSSYPQPSSCPHDPRHVQREELAERVPSSVSLPAQIEVARPSVQSQQAHVSRCSTSSTRTSLSTLMAFPDHACRHQRTRPSSARTEPITEAEHVKVQRYGPRIAMCGETLSPHGQLQWRHSLPVGSKERSSTCPIAPSLDIRIKRTCEG